MAAFASSACAPQTEPRQSFCWQACTTTRPRRMACCNLPRRGSLRPASLAQSATRGTLSISPSMSTPGSFQLHRNCCVCIVIFRSTLFLYFSLKFIFPFSLSYVLCVFHGHEAAHSTFSFVFSGCNATYLTFPA